MIREWRRSLNSFDAEIDTAIFVGREPETQTQKQMVTQNSGGPSLPYEKIHPVNWGYAFSSLLLPLVGPTNL